MFWLGFGAWSSKSPSKAVAESAWYSMIATLTGLVMVAGVGANELRIQAASTSTNFAQNLLIAGLILLVAGVLLWPLFGVVSNVSRSAVAKKLSTLFAIVTLSGGLVLALGFVVGVASNQGTQVAETEPDGPDALLNSIIRESEAKASAVFGDRDTMVDVQYRIDPWALNKQAARESYLVHVKELVPAFFDRYSKLDVVYVTARATVTNVRGHDEVIDGFIIKFTRKNAGTINWKRVLADDLPKIADGYSDPLMQ